MNPVVYYLLSAVLSAMVLIGLSMQSKVKSAATGNLMSAAAMAAAILITLIQANGLVNLWLWISMIIGSTVGILWAKKVQMIEMPQMVGALNGIGGLSSALVGGIELFSETSSVFGNVTACLAMIIGLITFSGSMIAALKLARKLPTHPIIIPGYTIINLLLILCMAAALILAGLQHSGLAFILALSSAVFGILFTLRVGGADMPVAISLLNSLSGVAGAIAGMAVYNVLLVAVGGIVGSSGLLLTNIMCKAMNRSLLDILLGRTTKTAPVSSTPSEKVTIDAAPEAPLEKAKIEAAPEVLTLKDSKNVIIVPGYGMALSQAQHKVKELRDVLMKQGAEVRFAIHPVAGRMPGHMNVLLAEADIDYDELFELDMINDDFKDADAVVVIGANDVLNPAAREAEGTPIYGMPIFNVDQASKVFICNFDLNPGYAGVENPLYTRDKGVRLLLGDAKDSLQTLINELTEE